MEVVWRIHKEAVLMGLYKGSHFVGVHSNE